MTEKRFIYTNRNGTMVIIDKKDNVLIRDKYRACDYLNRLANESEQLKIFLEALKEELSLANRDNDALEKENEELKQQIKDMKIRFKRKYDHEFDEIVDELW